MHDMTYSCVLGVKWGDSMSYYQMLNRVILIMSNGAIHYYMSNGTIKNYYANW